MRELSHGRSGSSVPKILCSFSLCMKSRETDGFDRLTSIWSRRTTASATPTWRYDCQSWNSSFGFAKTFSKLGSAREQSGNFDKYFRKYLITVKEWQHSTLMWALYVTTNLRLYGTTLLSCRKERRCVQVPRELHPRMRHCGFTSTFEWVAFLTSVWC